MSLRNPINTGICLGPGGTFCTPSGGSNLVIHLSSGITTDLLGSGTDLNPYIVEVKLSSSPNNGITVDDGLFVDSSSLLDISFSDELF